MARKRSNDPTELRRIIRELKAREHAYHRHILELQRYIQGLHGVIANVCKVVNAVDPALIPTAPAHGVPTDGRVSKKSA